MKKRDKTWKKNKFNRNIWTRKGWNWQSSIVCLVGAVVISSTATAQKIAHDSRKSHLPHFLINKFHCVITVTEKTEFETFYDLDFWNFHKASIFFNFF